MKALQVVPDIDDDENTSSEKCPSLTSVVPVLTAPILPELSTSVPTVSQVPSTLSTVDLTSVSDLTAPSNDVVVLDDGLSPFDVLLREARLHGSEAMPQPPRPLPSIEQGWRQLGAHQPIRELAEDAHSLTPLEFSTHRHLLQ